MTDKHPTQSMPDDGLEDAPDGTNRPGEARGKGGDSGGGPYANPHTGKGGAKGFRGGQSGMAYHGAHQLGTDRVDDEENTNAPARSD